MALNIDWGKNGEPPIITMTDDEKVEFIERPLYEKFQDDISQELIDECNNKSIENKKTLFIFDNRLSNIISEHNVRSRQEERVSNNLDLLFGSNKYYIGDIYEFSNLPSRKSFYDTETKMLGESRYNYITDYIKNLGFEPSEWNIGREYEQCFSFKSETINSFIRLKPNLFIEVVKFPNDVLYSGFFNKNSIINSLDTESIRDKKIELLIKKED
jgi:hypothetical protein